MKKFFQLFAFVVFLGIGAWSPSPAKAQGLVEYALILVVVYGAPGDSLEAVYRLEHAGAVGHGQPNCNFSGTAEIDFVEVATGKFAAETADMPIVLGDLNEFQYSDPLEFPPAPPGATLAAVVHLSGAMPANCTVVVNHFTSRFGATTEAVPEARAGVGRGTWFGYHDDSFDRTSRGAKDPDEPGLAGVVISLGESQVANLGLVARPKSIAPGRPPEDCALDGDVVVRRLDDDGVEVVIPFEGDPLAFAHDITDGLDPALPGETAYFEIVVTNDGPSLMAGSKPPCDDVQLVLGVAESASGETAASTYVNVHSARNLAGEIR